MSTAENKAVFLSYASQDAEAVRRIAEALRAAGVEVWFDQNELVGGDAWDAKIRKQIKECALFVPVISAATNARREGYFRREWKLAVDRTHDMDEALPFLLPVVIDETSDAGAFVPEKFREVQWTRLKGGEPSAAFCERVRRLLAGEAMATAGESGARKSEVAAVGHGRQTAATAASGSSRRVGVSLGVVVAAAVIAAGAWWRPWESVAPGKATTAAGGVKPPRQAQEFASRALELVSSESYTRDKLVAAEELVKKATELEGEWAHAWGVRAWLQASYILRNWDRGVKRQQAAEGFARKAQALDPNEPYALFASATVLSAAGAAPQAEALLRAEIQRRPDSRLAYGLLAEVLRQMGRREEQRNVLQDLLRRFPDDVLAHYSTALSYNHAPFTDAAKAIEQLDRALAIRPFVNAYYLKALILAGHRGDFAAMRATIDEMEKLPIDQRTEDQPLSLALWAALLERDATRVLATAALTTRPYFEHISIAGPRAWYAALAHRLAGNPARERSEWQAAETVLRERLRETPSAVLEQAQLAVTLAWLGADEEAARLAAAVEPLANETNQRVLTEMLAKYHTARGDAARAVPLLRKALNRDARVTDHTLPRDPWWDRLRETPEFVALLAEAKARADQSRGAAAAVPAVGEKSIAVLPFDNASEDKEGTSFFAEGMHEELLTSLAGIGELRVVSRTSVMEYRGTKQKMPQIARELGVAYVVQGSVHRAGAQVRVNAQLVRGATDQLVWAKTFGLELNPAEVFAVQATLATEIGDSLRAAISPETKKRLAERPTEDLAAYDLYLQAREALRGNLDRDGWNKAEACLKEALARDPKFGLAWAELSGLHSHYYQSNRDRSETRRRAAEQAKSQALRFAPNSPVVMRAVGDYYRDTLDYASARQFFEKLAQLQPNDSEVRHRLGNLNRREGRWQEALAEFRLGVQLDRRNARAVISLANLLFDARRYEEAAEMQREVVRLLPGELTERFWLAQIPFHATGSTWEVETFFASVPEAERLSPEVRRLQRIWALTTGDAAFFAQWDATTAGNLDYVDVAMMKMAMGDAAAGRAYAEAAAARRRARLETEPDNSQQWAMLAELEAILGNKAEALRCADRAVQLLPERLDKFIGLWRSSNRASVLAWVGEKERAIDEFARLLQLPTTFLNVHVMKRHPRYAPLRDEPRFKALLDNPKNNAPVF